LAWLPSVFEFSLPVLGNIVGGTIIFTLVAWGSSGADEVEENK